MRSTNLQVPEMSQVSLELRAGVDSSKFCRLGPHPRARFLDLSWGMLGGGGCGVRAL